MDLIQIQVLTQKRIDQVEFELANLKQILLLIKAKLLRLENEKKEETENFN